jgi:hypothetical protein
MLTGWRNVKLHCPVASRRGGVCEPAVKAWRNPLEHRGWAARERRIRSDLVGAHYIKPVFGVGGGYAECPCFAAFCLGHKHGLTALQHAADLSVGRRADSSFAAVVCGGTRPQPNGDDDHRLRRRGRAHPPRFVDEIRLVWCCLRVHPHELLERAATSAGVVAYSAGIPPQ